MILFHFSCRKRFTVMLPGIFFIMDVFHFPLAHPSHTGVSDQIHLALPVSHWDDLLCHSMVPCGSCAPGHSILFHPEILQGCFQVCIKEPSWKFLPWNIVHKNCGGMWGAKKGGNGHGILHLILRHEFETFTGDYLTTDPAINGVVTPTESIFLAPESDEHEVC